MSEERASADSSEEPDYYRLKEAAAPEAGEALFLKHPQHGWVPILDQHADIELSSVIIAIGDPDNGMFLELYESHYSNTEDIIVSADVAKEIRPENEYLEEDAVPADGIVALLNKHTPGQSNVNRYFEQLHE